jgi:hypothetical protein
MHRVGALALSFALFAACGGGSADRVGVTDGDPAPQPVELELRTPDGVPIFLGDLRGKPVLLFLFATFDGVSQAALRPLSRIVRHHPDVHVIGVAVQPEAEQLLDAWAYALSPPFTVAFDPRERIATGTSDLGEIESIPTYIVLDARGMEVDRHTGWASERQLDRMLEHAGPAAPPRAPEPRPLLAE